MTVTYRPTGTPDSRRVCELVAGKSGGVCLLGFSRGKDSIAAWLWLRLFFDRIVPFHCAVVPHLSFVDRSLEYYERVFETKIERCLAGYTYHAIQEMLFQPGEDDELIENMEQLYYGNNDVAEVVKKKHGLPPSTFTAYGISMTDSLFRRVRFKGFKDPVDGAWREKARTFYPCFDWTRGQVLGAVEKAGVKLPGDYLLANRTFAGIVTIRHLERMPNVYPEDWAKVEAMFPLVRAHTARNEFRRMKYVKGVP